MVKFLYFILFSVKDVFAHKLRASLSILGIVFGIAAVIAMVSISEGAKKDVLHQLKLLGMDNLSIVAKASDDQEEALNSMPLDYRDYEKIANLSFVKKASAVKTQVAKAFHKDKSVQSELFAVSDQYDDILKLSLATGRFLTEDDITMVKNVCVIGAGIKNALFGIKAAIGELIKVKGDWYRVVGVITEQEKEKQPKAISFKNIDGAVILPISAYYKTFFTLFEKNVDEISLTITSGYDKKRAVEGISAVIAKASPKKKFDVIIPSELIAQSYETKRIFNVVLGVIAAISLLVGGIGIMNIMLANVSERTREIGIRRAIGAKKSDIMLQFVLESLVLTSLGGTLGVLLGVIGAAYLNFTIGWTVYISPTGAVLSLLMASLTGMILSKPHR